MSLEDNDSKLLPFGSVEINDKDFNKEPDIDRLQILATRNLVLFPGIVIPLALTRDSSYTLALTASNNHTPIGIVCQRNPHQEEPTTFGDLYDYGVIADVLKVIELPDGNRTAIIRGRQRFKIIEEVKDSGTAGTFRAKVSLYNDRMPKNILQFENMMTVVSENAIEVLSGASDIPVPYSQEIKGIQNSVERLNFIATHLPCSPEEKIHFLSRSTVLLRAKAVLATTISMKEKQEIYNEIIEGAKSKMTENQRMAFLQSQLDVIKDELYGGTDVDTDIESLKEQARKSMMPDPVYKVFEKELNKLGRLNINSPDYAVQYAYLDTLSSLPWAAGEIETNITKAKEILNNSHYGLDKINKRILEQMAVILSSKQNPKTPILCLVGPPGVGKTSLGRTIAKAMGRKYRRVALGGVHDESEIRGHRRTYIGAMPGRIIKAIKDSGVANPVILLDEVDKLGNDHRGDPSSALLEVLDPEQNMTFHDNYVDVDYDLSKVLFIATANDISKVDGPLRDRMEVIELSGYLPEEKIEIARRHIIPKIIEDNGFENASEFQLTDEAINAIIDNYTSESGVRSLEKTLASLLRKRILADLSGDDFPKIIDANNLTELLGKPKVHKDKYEEQTVPGVVTGLAWTAVGGEILLAEVSLSPGKGDKITITGNLGDVMKESATIALQWVKSNHIKLGISKEALDSHNLHIHFPEGAIPKDGPSAGITMTTAIVSAFTERVVSSQIAMTGEMTLRGKVLPVGGIREKILAARRYGVETIILSCENRQDIEEIPEQYLKNMSFKFVKTIDEVLKIAFNE